MKEAICMLALYTILFKVDIRFLLTVHDELVIDSPDDYVKTAVKKTKKLMIRAANNYLIPEVGMDVDDRIAKYWKK